MGDDCYCARHRVWVLLEWRSVTDPLRCAVCLVLQAATSGDMRPDPHAARVQQQQQPLKPGGFCGVFSCFCPATPGSPPSREQPYIVTSHGTMETASTMQVDASVRPGKQQQQPGGAQGPHPTVEHAEAPVERLSPGSLSTSQYQDSSSIKVDPISPKGLPVQPLAH